MHVDISLIPYLEEPVKEVVFMIEMAIEQLGIRHHHILTP